MRNRQSRLMPRLGISSLALTVFLLLCSQTAFSQVLPSKTWRTVTVGEFDLIFDAQHQEIAEIYAQRLAKLNSTLRPYWKNIPSKTAVVLNDRTDLTNGFATFLPYSYIMIFPALPGPMDSIGEYHDWAWELMVHEYTHTLSFEQRRGLVKGLSWIMGSIITPNALLPTWWLEGVAVDAETRVSSGGRLRSNLQAASVRAMVLNNSLETFGLAQINEGDIPSWPYGARRYLFGSLLWSEMIADQGEAIIGELHHRMGGRAPFFIKGPMNDLFQGRDQLSLYQQMQKNARAEAEKQLAILKKTPLTEGKVIDGEMAETLSPVLSPDGLKLAYVARNQILRRRVQLLVRKKVDENFDASMRISNFGKDWDAALSPSALPRRGQEHDAPPGGNINRVSWHPNSTQFVFDQVVEKNRFEEYSDLWVFDLSKGKAEALTKSARAREPSYSPSGEQIAFVEIEPGVNHLGLWDVASKTRKRIYKSPIQGRVSFPAWLDSERIIFSLRENGVDRALVKNLKTDEVTEVLQSFKDPLFFYVQKDRILFTSTQNGVRNLYESSLNLDKVRPITNSATHVFLAAYDHGAKNYIYTELTDRGLTMKSVPEATVQNTTLSSIEPFWGSRHPPRPVSFEKSEPALTAKAEDYSAAGYLWPRYWMPFVNFDGQNVLLSLSTTGQDPLGKHSYFLSGIYDPAVPNPSGVFVYTNQSFWPLYSLSAYDVSLAGATAASTSRTQLGQVGAAWEIASISPDWFLTAGYSYMKRNRLQLVSDLAGPFIGTSYNNASRTAAQVSPESGWSGALTLSYRRHHQLERNNATADFNLSYFWSRWLPSRNALMLKLNGRYSDERILFQNLEQSSALSLSSNPTASSYLMRGYVSGTFLGRNILNPILEYRFPISRIDYGPATMPLYANRIHGAIVADGIYFDGYVFDRSGPTAQFLPWRSGASFWSAGIEARLDMNIGYHIPLGFMFGVYWPLNHQFVEAKPLYGFGFVL